jgi:ATP-dependent DNA helicase RecG
MRENMRSAGLAPPEFDSDRSADHFITTFYLHHFLASEDLDWLGQFKHLNLSEAQVRGLIHAREAGRIDNETYREINGVETLEASQDLRSLRDAGLLDQHERSRATYYEPTEKLLGAEPTAQGEIPFEETEPENTQVEGESDQAEEESPKLSGETTQAEGEITQADTEPTQAEEQPAPEEEKLPKEIQALLDEWGGKGPPEELQRVILRLCEWKPLSAMELAQYVQRDRRYLMRNYIRTLVEEGALERTRPDAPRSPNQKYQVPSADAEE